MAGARLGVVCGLKAEAACLAPVSAVVVVRPAGGDPDRAAWLAETLVADGVAALVSFGLAGGLDPTLAPGDLIIADTILGPVPAPPVAAPPTWTATLAAHARTAGCVVRIAPVIGAAAAVATPADKRALFELSGAAAVDLESHAVARVAAAAGLPVTALRAIGDPAGRGLPACAAAALAPDGSPRLAPVLRGLARRPSDLWPLLRVAADSARALGTLRRAATAVEAAHPNPPP